MAKCMETRIFPTPKSYSAHALNRHNEKINMKLADVRHFQKIGQILFLVPVFTKLRAHGATSDGSPHTSTQSLCRGTTYWAKYVTFTPKYHRTVLSDSNEHIVKMNVLEDVIKEYGLFQMLFHITL
jgi:hypothetical protein